MRIVIQNFPLREYHPLGILSLTTLFVVAILCGIYNGVSAVNSQELNV